MPWYLNKNSALIELVPQYNPQNEKSTKNTIENCLLFIEIRFPSCANAALRQVFEYCNPIA